MTQRNRGGDGTRDLVVRVRVTLAEKTRLLELAARAGLTPSDYVRSRTIAAAVQGRKATPDRTALIKLTAELNKVGSNVNQIARALNRRQETGQPVGLSMDIVNAAMQDIRYLSSLIAKELGHGYPG